MTIRYLCIVIVIHRVLCQSALASALTQDLNANRAHMFTLRPLARQERPDWHKILGALVGDIGSLKHEVLNCVFAWGAMWETSISQAGLNSDLIFQTCNSKYEELIDVITPWAQKIDNDQPQPEFGRLLSEADEISRRLSLFLKSLKVAQNLLSTKKDQVHPRLFPELHESMRLAVQLVEFADWSTKAFLTHQGCDLFGKPEPIDIRVTLGLVKKYFDYVSNFRHMLTLDIRPAAKGPQITAIPSIYMDPGICLTVFNNLVRNSCEIARRRGIKHVVVTITFEQDPEREDGLVVICADNGPGFVDKQGRPLPDPNVVFEKGFTTRDKPDGHGVGLYIVKAQLAQVKADIEAKNPENSAPGAVFEIRFLPCAATMEILTGHFDPERRIAESI
ncbi:MAG: ATP-binding protein [Candidatus Omnitrophica bacterium]|nr:ATP-binding protein [Candidatus Omnitrophota bacterium]